MGQKRKPEAAKAEKQERPEKKARQDDGSRKTQSQRLVFSARPDWHAAGIPVLPVDPEAAPPSQRVIEELHAHATTLLAAENIAYNAAHLSGSSSHKFLSTIMASGTLEDKVSALTLLIQESPLHTMKAFENLVALSKKKSRNQALMAVAALKDLLGQGVVLPADRKLRAFGKQPALATVLQGKAARWTTGQPLPSGLTEAHLVVWAYEDWLKRMYFELLQVLESWCGDEVEYARSRAVTYVWELLKEKPEQEENLLRLLVNKLGDNDRKIASRASYLLLQLETSHPAMKMIITNSIEADSLLRPGQSLHAKYYAIITLNQTILSQKEPEVATRLLDIFFSLFVQLLKPAEAAKPNTAPSGKQQGGGGVAGKAAAKKAKAQERVEDADVQLKDKMIAQVLTGVNRAFPYADTSDPTFEKQLDTLFRVTHSANFSTAIQALMLLQQISSTKNFGAERYYRTLYESLLDPRLVTSSKQTMYLNLVYKSLKADLDAKRVQAFVKRLLQIITLHEPPFICGVLYLISELEGTFPSIRIMITDASLASADADAEEHFADVDDERADSGTANMHPSRLPKPTSNGYDARKRDPSHAHAEHSPLWDLLPFLAHFHPSVHLFATSLLEKSALPQKPDPAQHTLMHFLDRFVYRAPKKVKEGGEKVHGSSIMQPLGGSRAADLLVKPGERGAAGNVQVNSEAFWARRVENVGVDEVFFHDYFRQVKSGAGVKGKKAKAAAAKKDSRKAVDEDDSEGGEEQGEEEIWKAIVNSRPEVEGDSDSDDDLSMGDLESAYSDSEDGSEPGIDLGGEGGESDDEAPPASPTLEAAEDDDDFPDFDKEEEDDVFGDDDLLPMDLGEGKDEGGVEVDNKARNKAQRNKKKSIKSLPTFASAEDYAKLMGGNGNEDDDDDGIY
ncbi:hypothetical protein B0A48_07994 [Cryoendolithus antarcticus]|uniref:CCAAT-binding factor domain-containing protein n=1 Tax=Cryoendolithus antarcticus TaxID=1507870 RepID=A0A1V8T0Q0_9PEZI|nr:hypothetical protein B0A48_07994 [Cryoendolithus antarcticus]